MAYGTKHEIDGIATLIIRFLPAYYPNLNYVEEGCVVVNMHSVPMVVSPDGSLRQDFDNDQSDMMFENKCRQNQIVHVFIINWPNIMYYRC